MFAVMASDSSCSVGNEIYTTSNHRANVWQERLHSTLVVAVRGSERTIERVFMLVLYFPRQKWKAASKRSNSSHSLCSMIVCLVTPLLTDFFASPISRRSETWEDAITFMPSVTPSLLCPRCYSVWICSLWSLRYCTRDPSAFK